MELKVYLTNLHAYTTHNLRGKWVELPVEPSELEKIKKEVLSMGGGEELFITDSTFNIGEYANLDEYNELFLYAKENGLLNDAIALLKYDLWVKPTDVLKWLEDSSYSIIEAEDNEELGRYVVEENLISNADLIKQVPEHYINFELIGEEYSINNNATQWDKKYILIN